MRRVLAVSGLLLLVAPAAATARESGSHLVFTTRFTQEATYQKQTPAGRQYSVTLKMFANADNPFNAPANAVIGGTQFTYTISGSCSGGIGGCKGTASIHTTSNLPGGSVITPVTTLPISRLPYVLTISKG